MIKAILLDIDGTLTNDEKVITPRTREALLAAQNNGYDMHYCIGDVHGCYDELMSLIQKIEKQDDNAQFIFTGDFADRGPKVWETMEWIAEHLNPVERFTGLIGNHDRLLFDWYFEWFDWYKKQPFFDRLFNRMDRSEEPKPDYDFYEVAEAHHALCPHKLNRYIGAISAMPYHKVIEIEGRNGASVTFDIVHGWYSYDYPENSYGQRMFNTWARECEGNHINDHVIVHGHTPTITELYTRDPATPPGMIAYRKNAINLDGGCCYYTPDGDYPCMLCAVCLETLEEFYSHSLEQRLGKEKGYAFRQKYYQTENPYRREILERLNGI